MYLGIEIGGTKLQLGLGDGDGKLQPVGHAQTVRRAVQQAAGAAGIRQQIEEMFPELLAQTGIDSMAIQAVGIGFGGPFDDTTQRTIKSHHIEGWDDFPLYDWATNLFQKPVSIGNDADVAGLGEAHFGAGQGISPLFYITVGTGIGGGLILNQQIYRAIGRGAGEIGHLKVLDWSRAGTPLMVPLEHVASGQAIGLRAQELAREGEAVGSLLWEYVEGDPEKMTGELVGRAARRKDRFALQILREATDALAEAICQMIVLFCPRRVVIGGGVANLGDDLFFAPIRESVAQQVFPPFAGLTEIVPAALGDEVVIHGAIALAQGQAKQQR